MKNWITRFLSRRPRLQFRLRTVLALVTVLCIYFAWPHLARQYAFWRLCRYGDCRFTDLWEQKEGEWNFTPKSPKTEHVQALLRRLLPIEREDWHCDELAGSNCPSIVHRVRIGDGRLIVVRATPPFMIPGSGDVRVVIFDRLGRAISDNQLSTGNRFVFDKFDFEASRHGVPCIGIEGEFVFMGLRQRQFIAIGQDRLSLVRIENETPPEDAAMYRSRHTLGAGERFENHAAWAEALSSPDPITVLEALLYLPPQEAVSKQDANDIRQLEALSQSKHPWIAEGAVAALDDLRSIHGRQ